MAQRLLEGEYENVIDVKAGASDEELRQLRQENRKLDEALRAVRNELGQAIADKENLERSIRALRNQLAPLHRFLRALFGEIELAVGEEEITIGPRGGAASSQSNDAPASTDNARWNAVKEQFPGSPARVIDALLTQGAMATKQISIFARMHYDTAKSSVAKLRGAGAVISEGGINRLNR